MPKQSWNTVEEIQWLKEIGDFLYKSWSLILEGSTNCWWKGGREMLEGSNISPLL